MGIAIVTPRFFNTELDSEKIKGIVTRLTTKLMEDSISEKITWYAARKYITARTPIGDDYWLSFDEVIAIKKYFKRAGWSTVEIDQSHYRGDDPSTPDKTTKVIVTLYFPLSFKDIFTRLFNLTT